MADNPYDPPQSARSPSPEPASTGAQSPVTIYDPYAMPADALAEPPTSLWLALRKIGPGIILAGSIIGSGELLLTSMDRDGTRAGYDVALTHTIAESVGIPVIASGGVGSPEHLLEGLTAGSADAVLAASIFHYGEFTIRACKEFLRSHGVHVRL